MPTIHSHTKTMPDGSLVDVFKLHELVKNRKSFKLHITDIQKPNKSKRTGFSRIRSEKADVSFPLMITDERFLIDGRHRYFKLIDRGLTDAEVVIATKDDIEKATL